MKERAARAAKASQRNPPLARLLSLSVQPYDILNQTMNCLPSGLARGIELLFQHVEDHAAAVPT